MKHTRRVFEEATVAKILVIDDEPNVRTLLEMRLRQQGYDVLFADSGWKGLQLYRQEYPDVIVLDLRIPELDGITVLEQIRSVDPKQPVIILTGDTSPETERQVRALGVSGFIIKGSSMQQLVDTLRCLLKASSLAISGVVVIETLAS